MIHSVTVKGITIGEGMPKVIVPIVAADREDILEKAEEIRFLNVQMVEWRADFYEDVADPEKTLGTLRALRKALGSKLLLYTFRSSGEGGNREIAADEYRALNLAVADSAQADFVDVEVFSLGVNARSHIAEIHHRGAYVIGSSHDFEKTPKKEELVRRMRWMQEVGADIPKLAVMPTCTKDVLDLLDATREMTEAYADRPVITMSMAPLGVISRLSGELFGSAMTFGAVGSVSAPGQIPVDQLNQCLTIFHNAL